MALKVAYIAGSGRSGSTLLDQLLGRYPNTFSCGELNNLLKAVNSRSERCSCGERADQCPFWRAVLPVWRDKVPDYSVAEYSDLQDKFERVRSLLKPSVAHSFRQRAFARYCVYTKALYEAIAHCSGAGIIIDSTKNPAKALALSRVEGIELYMLHLVRDVRGVAYSWLQSCRAAEQQGMRGPVGLKDNLKSVAAWVVVNYFCEHVRKRLDHPSLLVRYEDYCANTDSVLREIAEAFRLTQMQEPAEKKLLHQIAGNDIRLRPVQKISSDMNWRRGLRPLVQKMLYLLVLPWMYRYRYHV